MKTTVYLTALIGALIAGGFVRYLWDEPTVAVVEEVPVIIEPLIVYVDRVMSACNVTVLSPARRSILANQITRIAESSIKGRQEQEAFVLLLCIESKFDQRAKSPVGASGLAQVMPQFADGFGKQCGYEGLKGDDLQDSEVNLLIGACVFTHLVKQFDSIPIALAAYNAGAASSSVKNLKALTPGSAETTAYLAKHYVLRERVGTNEQAEERNTAK